MRLFTFSGCWLEKSLKKSVLLFLFFSQSRHIEAHGWCFFTHTQGLIRAASVADFLPVCGRVYFLRVGTFWWRALSFQGRPYVRCAHVVDCFRDASRMTFSGEQSAKYATHDVTNQLTFVPHGRVSVRQRENTSCPLDVTMGYEAQRFRFSAAARFTLRTSRLFECHDHQTGDTYEVQRERNAYSSYVIQNHSNRRYRKIQAVRCLCTCGAFSDSILFYRRMTLNDQLS